MENQDKETADEIVTYHIFQFNIHVNGVCFVYKKNACTSKHVCISATQLSQNL